MIRRFCDRCNKDITDSYIEIDAVVRPYKLKNESFCYMLCEKCMTDLKDFIKHGGDNNAR